MDKIWKSVVWSDGEYQVSNTGKVKSLNRVITTKYGVKRVIKGRVLKPTLHGRGYLMVYISTKGLKTRVYVHRLVAEAFIPNPDNLPQVNHKNEVKTDNTASNLEWCNHRYNIAYSGNMDKAVKASLKTRLRPVVQKNKGVEIARYASIKEAAWSTGLCEKSIGACCRGKCKTIGGYEWSYMAL